MSEFRACLLPSPAPLLRPSARIPDLAANRRYCPQADRRRWRRRKLGEPAIRTARTPRSAGPLPHGTVLRPGQRPDVLYCSGECLSSPAKAAATSPPTTPGCIDWRPVAVPPNPVDQHRPDFAQQSHHGNRPQALLPGDRRHGRMAGAWGVRPSAARHLG